jgi:hypothetical protein
MTDNQTVQPVRPPQTYTARLINSYRYLFKSRVVRGHEVDDDSLTYFERFCNDALPRNESEAEMRETIKSLYHADKKAFNLCIEKNSHFILLTEARAIVVHFGISNLIYIDWDKQSKSYKVKKNSSPVVSDKYQNKKNTSKYDKKKKASYQELLDRIDKLENTKNETGFSKTESDHKSKVETVVETNNWADAADEEEKD